VVCRVSAEAAKREKTQMSGNRNERDVVRNAAAESARDTNGEITVPIQEEELVASKRVEEQGQVRLHKGVVTEQQSVTVPVQHEQVSIERVPVEQEVDSAAAAAAFQEGDLEVPVMGEEVVTRKHAHVVEEVRLHKDVVTEKEQVSDTVRKEQVSIDDASATTTRRALSH